MMKPRDFFPLGKAYGEAFCNRTEETKALVGNIENGKHTFLSAPRRYGKSSLCENTIRLAAFPNMAVDLHVATTEKGVERCIVKGVIELIGKAIGQIDKSLQVVKHTFKNLKPKLSFEAAAFKLEIETSDKASSPEVIQEALLLLDKLLAAKDQRAVLLIDEFQRVVEIAPNKGIEGGIRSAAQETKNLSLIFSGSSRHMIESIFQNEGRPLYKLCKKIKLNRINEQHYQKHLEKAAILMWKKPLSSEVFDKIIYLTERHPYYINYLCDYLWTDNECLPSVDDVIKTWNQVIEEDRSDLLREYFTLSENQKKLLRYIALNPGSSLYTLEASKLMEMQTTSVSYALTELLEKDIVETYNPKHYRVINPTFKKLLEV